MSLYKLWNKVFGWDYIHWQDSADRGIARVQVTPDGKVWYYRYKGINYVDPLPNPRAHIIWLTCKPTKYIKPIDIRSGEDVCV